MMMTHIKPQIGAEALLGLLAKPVSHGEVSRLLGQLGIQEQLEAGLQRTSVAVSAPEHGVGLRFKQVEQLRDAASYPVAPKTLLTAAVFFHNQGVQGHTAFSGALPHGLSFGQSRAFVREALGQPSGSSARHKNDIWEFGERYLTIDFAEDELGIQLVTVGLPWKRQR